MTTTTRQVCTAEKPMPEGAEGMWEHPGAKMVDTDYESMYGDYERYECPNCGKRFWVELPD